MPTSRQLSPTSSSRPNNPDKRRPGKARPDDNPNAAPITTGAALFLCADYCNSFHLPSLTVIMTRPRSSKPEWSSAVML